MLSEQFPINPELTISRTSSNQGPDFISVQLRIEYESGGTSFIRLEVPLAEFALILTGRAGIRVKGTETFRTGQG